MNRQLLLLFCIFCFPVYGENNQNLENKSVDHSSYLYGGIGLINVPNARFSEDGDFKFGLSSEAPFSRMYANMQFFPWMEATLKYTENSQIPYSAGSQQTWKDKGLDLKFRLLKESDILPNLALGLLDIGGTGAYSAEYIVASKSFNNLDLTIGLGWGLLGGVNHLNNIVGLIDDRRNIRRGGGGLGGKIDLDQFFSGENTSIFGGIEYFTPIDNLSLKLEYDPTKYDRNFGKELVFNEQGDIFELDSRINYAINYRINLSERDRVDLSLGLVRGNTIYGNFSVHSNLNQLAKPKFEPYSEIINVPSLEPYQALNPGWKKYLTDTIIWQMGNVGFVTHNIIFKEDELQVEISQGRFQKPINAIDLASRILGNNSPKNIKKITIINIDQGLETLRASVSREDLVMSVSKGMLDESLLTFNEAVELEDSDVIVANDDLYPNFFWQIKPHMLGTLQHQERFYFWQLEALIHTEYSFRKGLYLTTDVGIDIANNYDEYTYHIPDGELHHVRQDRRLYLTEGKSGLRRMAIDYLVDFNNQNLKAKMSFGYLEWMYGGLGGEVLYMPDHRRWALGIDAYWVKQREFDQSFSFREYETVTGFISYYQDIPFYDMRLKVSAGKFLGKDTGMYFDLSRRFKTGARVGGAFALTNCDSACVGEGSFNKWIYFEIPMDLYFTQSNTRGKAGYVWSPLTKDAGTKVEQGSLYNLMMNATDEVDSLRQTSWSIRKIFGGFSTKKQSLTRQSE